MKSFLKMFDTLQPPKLEWIKPQSSRVLPADAFAIYFNFLYNLGLSPFKLRIYPETGTFKVITNWKQKVRNNLTWKNNF